MYIIWRATNNTRPVTFVVVPEGEDNETFMHNHAEELKTQGAIPANSTYVLDTVSQTYDDLIAAHPQLFN